MLKQACDKNSGQQGRCWDLDGGEPNTKKRGGNGRETRGGPGGGEGDEPEWIARRKITVRWPELRGCRPAWSHDSQNAYPCHVGERPKTLNYHNAQTSDAAHPGMQNKVTK